MIKFINWFYEFLLTNWGWIFLLAFALGWLSSALGWPVLGLD